MKILIIASLVSILIAYPFIQAYSSWTDYKNVHYMDLDGDLVNEIIIETKHGAGSNHYIEDMRIFKDKYPELELIFTVTTLDSYFGLEASNNYNIVSDVKFTEQTPENKGIRDIVVTAKKVYFKDKDNKIIDKKEGLRIRTFKWDGTNFVENKVTNPNFASKGTVYPKDLPNFENFDERGLEIIQKEVDKGHQPWRSWADYYAKFFMNFYYPTLSPNDRENLPAELQLEGKQAVVKVFYDDKEHTIYLHKAFPSNPESIWIVEKMKIE